MCYVTVTSSVAQFNNLSAGVYDMYQILDHGGGDGVRMKSFDGVVDDDQNEMIDDPRLCVTMATITVSTPSPSPSTQYCKTC